MKIKFVLRQKINLFTSTNQIPRLLNLCPHQLFLATWNNNEKRKGRDATLIQFYKEEREISLFP